MKIKFYKNFLIILIMSLILLPASCNSESQGTPAYGNDLADIFESSVSDLTKRFSMCYNKTTDPQFKLDQEDEALIILISAHRDYTNKELEKRKLCRDNIEQLACDSETLLNGKLSDIEGCLYYENTDGFPSLRTSCENFFYNFCYNSRGCTDDVECFQYAGGPFREACSEELRDGDYQCTGSISKNDICVDVWTEYTNGCHDFPGFIDESKISKYCDHLSSTSYIEDSTLQNQFTSCSEAISNYGMASCSLYDEINYDFETITECQFLFD
jgi:hypothetical protein